MLSHVKTYIRYVFLEIYQNINKEFIISQIEKEQSDRTRTPDQRSMTKRFVGNIKLLSSIFFIP